MTLRARGSRKTLAGPDAVRLAWSTIQAFVRITAHPAVFTRPFSMAEAGAIVDEWLTLPHLGLIEPGERYCSILHRPSALARFAAIW